MYLPSTTFRMSTDFLLFSTGLSYFKQSLKWFIKFARILQLKSLNLSGISSCLTKIMFSPNTNSSFNSIVLFSDSISPSRCGSWVEFFFKKINTHLISRYKKYTIKYVLQPKLQTRCLRRKQYKFRTQIYHQTTSRAKRKPQNSKSDQASAAKKLEKTLQNFGSTGKPKS